MTDDAELLVGVRSNDRQACASFVRRFGPRMLSVARRLLGDDMAAEDCVQEAFLNAFRTINQFEERSSLATWMHRIVVNAALMKLRAAKRRREGSIEELLPDFDQRGCRIEPIWQQQQSAEEMVQQREIQDLVMSKVDELPENYRTVFILRDIEDMSTSDVATLMESSAGAVKIRLHRARAALKKLLEPIWEGREQ
jgi:RNA polymerase sigma-70 factor, ECF subfamily